MQMININQSIQNNQNSDHEPLEIAQKTQSSNVAGCQTLKRKQPI